MAAQQQHNKSRGFTIVELMVAISVFSVILLMATVILIQVGALYSKGVNAANLQSTARNIVADVTANIQFNGNTPVSCTLDGSSPATFANSTTCYATGTTPNDTETNAYVFCIGTTRYTYLLNKELGSDPGATGNPTTTHVLWRDTMPKASNACTHLDLSNQNPTTAAGAAISVPGSGYEMVPEHMRLTRFEVYPDPTATDLYNMNVWMAYGDSDLVLPGSTPGGSICSGGQGTQFCSVSEISTTVIQRVN